MKKTKICFISYFFPPIQAPGCSRVYWFVKEAEKHGFEPFVITVKPDTRTTMPAGDNSFDLDGMQVYRTKGFDMNAFVKNTFSSRKKGEKISSSEPALKVQSRKSELKKFITHILYSFYKNIICFPDQCFFWKYRALREVVKIVEDEKPDIIYTTAPPGSCCAFGYEIKKRFPEIIWIADFRDLWSENEVHKKPQPLFKLERFWERRILAKVDHIITTTTNFSNAQKALHPEKQVETIYNGYDVDLPRKPLINKNRKFTIVYTGAIYFTANRDMSLFFNALKELADEDEIDLSKVACNIYGNIPSDFAMRIAHSGLTDIISHVPSIPRNEVLELQKKADMLLLVEWTNGAIPIKLFEYLATGLPILAMAHPESAIDKIMKQCSAGCADSSLTEIKFRLKSSYEKWDKQGKTVGRINLDSIREYSRTSQCRYFYKLLNRMLP